METKVSVRGMVRDIVLDFEKANTGMETPQVWTNTEDLKSGRKVLADAQTAEEMVHFLTKVREWAVVAATFADPRAKANAMFYLTAITKEFAIIAGITIENPRRVVRGKDIDAGTSTAPTLPSEIVDDLEPGDEVMVVRHITRWGMNKYESFPARIKGRAANGDYWLTSLEDMSSRACRNDEVIVTKRMKVGA